MFKHLISVLVGEEALPADTWTHLTATYDGTTQRLYVNGDEVASRPQTGQLGGSSAPLRIGGNSVWGEYFQGQIDEVRLYSRALTASEIRADMHLPVVPPAVTTAVDKPIDIVVLPSGAVVGGNAPTVVGVTQGVHGTVVSNADGTVRYTPNAGFRGQDTFAYTLSDGHGGIATGTVTVTVIPVTDALFAPNEAVATSVGTAVDIAVPVTDVNGDVLTVVGVTQGVHGTVAVTATGIVHYTPNPDFRGQDSFAYTVRDNQGRTATTTVTVTITAVNTAPVAIPQSVMTAEDTPVAIMLTGSDVDGDTLTFTIAIGPANGILSGTPPTVTYTPNANFNGTDRFTFRVSDGILSSTPATVSITRLINGGFESGDFTGWSTIGETRIETAAFGSGPTEGRFQAFLSTAGAAENTGDPVGNAVLVPVLETFLSLLAGSLDHMSTDTVVEGSAIRRTFTAQAGDVVSFDWNFLTNESTNLNAPDAPANPEMNDIAFVTIVSPSLLADTAFWTFSLSRTALFGETGFNRFSFTIPTTGTYTLGIGVIDVGDGGGLSGLLVDNVSLTPVNP